MERRGEERLVKRVYRANVEGNWRRGRQQRRWRDEVKDLLKGGGLRERERESVMRTEGLFLMGKF